MGNTIQGVTRAGLAISTGGLSEVGYAIKNKNDKKKKNKQAELLASEKDKLAKTNEKLADSRNRYASLLNDTKEEERAETLI